MLELNLIGRNRDAQGKLRLHFILVSGFLVVAHIAMILGMINSTIFQMTTMS